MPVPEVTGRKGGGKWELRFYNSTQKGLEWSEGLSYPEATDQLALLTQRSDFRANGLHHKVC
jgi:hypothetical protein